jgi:hypothetical protein
VSYDNQPEAVDTATDALETTEIGVEENLGDGATSLSTSETEGGPRKRSDYYP